MPWSSRSGRLRGEGFRLQLQGDESPILSRRSSRHLLVVWVVALTSAIVSGLLLHLRGAPDIDLWLHLRIGDELRAGASFQGGHDPLVVLADRPYVPTQWLAEVVGSVAHDLGGLTAILWLRFLALVSLTVVVYLVARLDAGPRRAALAAVLGVVATSAAWGERPQLAGAVLEAVTLWLWSRCRRRGTTPWAVVPLFWLWACVHGTWIIGLLTGELFSLLIVVDARWRLPRRRSLRLLAVHLLSLVAVAVTPLGPGLLLEPFKVNEVARATVNEWQPPAPGNPLMLLVLLMASAVLASVPLQRRRWRESLGHLLLVSAGIALAVYSVRTIAFAGMLLVPALAAAFGPRATLRDPVRPRELLPWLAAAVVLAVMPGVLLGVDTRPPIASGISSGLDALPAGSPVVVDVRVSGWVLHAHPRLRPLRDLRAEVYSPATAHAYEAFMKGEPGWRQYADDHQVRAMLLGVGAPLAPLLSGDGWQVVASDTTYELWIPRGQALSGQLR